MREKNGPIYVIDDQIGRPGSFQRDFLAKVAMNTGQFIFDTGQAGGKNDINGIMRRVSENWRAGPPSRLSLLLLDMRFDEASPNPEGDTFGFAVLEHLRREFGRNLPIVVLTTEEETNRGSNQLQADDFLSKEELSEESLRRVFSRHGLFPDEDGRLIGSSLDFLLTLREIRRFVNSRASELLLLGETGTGKTALVTFLYERSRRSGRLETWYADPASKDLHYDQLFGHWAEAFTDARENVAGSAERAHQGVFFLDEVGELAGETQVQLLEHRDRGPDGFRRIKRKGHYLSGLKRAKEIKGGTLREKLDLWGEYSEEVDRVLVDTIAVFASNKRLEDPGVRDRLGFRKDLFERLGNRLTVPPLRNRRSDILPLFEAKLGALRGQLDLPPAETESEAVDLLVAYDWRGNIPELHRLAERVHGQLGESFHQVFAHHLDSLGSDKEPKKPHIQAQYQGGLAQAEISAMSAYVDSLRAAIRSTFQDWRIKRQVSVTGLVAFATGTDLSTTEAKRILKEKLEPIMNPKQLNKKRWNSIPGYKALAKEVRQDALLVPLYDYATDKKNWSDACNMIATALRDDGDDNNKP